jgi:hypothetical protein
MRDTTALLKISHQRKSIGFCGRDEPEVARAGRWPTSLPAPGLQAWEDGLLTFTRWEGLSMTTSC